jgi:hypothetical protein
MKYTHIIVSRINIKTTEYSKDNVWLKNRIEVFNKTLRPSIAGQICKNFKFITLWGYEPIDCIEGEIPIVIKSDGFTQIMREMKPKLLEQIDDEYVLMTRVDSDNCLGDGFVETLQNNINEEVPFYYDIKKMNVIDLKTEIKSTWDVDKTSGFISVMEKTKDFEHIPFKYMHNDIGKYVNGITLDLDVLLTIHGDNLCVKKNFGVKNNFDLKKYNLK